MAAALECWSSRASTDEDIVEQVLFGTQDRSEALRTASSSSFSSSSLSSSSSSSSAVQKKLHKFGRNVAEAITNFKKSLNLDSVPDPSSPTTTTRMPSCRKVVLGGVLENLTHLYPGNQLPEKLISNIRKHFDSLPRSYSQAGFDMKDVFLHVRLLEQADIEDQPAILIQEVSSSSDDDDHTKGSFLKLTFACNCSISWQVVSNALDNAVIRCKKMQIFEKKGFALGIVLVVVQFGREKFFKMKIENALKSVQKKSKATNTTTTMKLPFGFCGCQEENSRVRELGEIDYDCENLRTENSNNVKINLQTPLETSSFEVSVDEWQTIRSGGDEIGKWILNSEYIDFTDQIGPNSFKGVYKGKRVAIEKIRGCEKGSAYEFELQRDLLELMSCGHKNILEFCGVCIDENHGLCVVTKMMEGGTVHEMIIQKRKKVQIKEIILIAIDVAEGIKFMNENGVCYKDLNSQKILLDWSGNACVGDMGIVSVCRNNGEVTDYETDGFRWLAPEIIAGDPESVAETWMSNVYSFGMVLWEMVAGEAAYSAYSPVQAAVGIAACGLRPEIPKDCPPVLRSLMLKCWNSTPSKRPQFSEILNMLLRSNSNNR